MQGSYNPPELVIKSQSSAMDSPTQPWYLSTKAIIRVVKKAVTTLSTNQALFDQALFGINTLSQLLKNKTDAGVLIIDLEKASVLIDELDQTRSEQFVRLDGFDHLRGLLATALRNLIARIIEQQRIATDYRSGAPF